MQSLLKDFEAADTQVVSISVDSIYCHKSWAESLGGITYPMLADFQPKGAVAEAYGLYLADKGITDRATVIVDKDGVVQYADSVGPGGKREAADLLAAAQKVNG